MSLLALAYWDRQTHKPQRRRTSLPAYVGPVDPRFGQLPGWVSQLTRLTYPHLYR